MPDDAKLTVEQQTSLKNLIGSFNYLHNASCGIVYHLAS